MNESLTYSLEALGSEGVQVLRGFGFERDDDTLSPTSYHFWCHSCSQLVDADPEYYSLLGEKTCQLVTREQVVVESRL